MKQKSKLKKEPSKKKNLQRGGRKPLLPDLEDQQKNGLSL
jgi:hypothetical protein